MVNIKNGKKISEWVEKYGAADEAEKKAKADKAAAREEIEKLLKVGESGRSTHYLVTVSERVGRVLNNAKVLKRIGSKQYSEISDPKIGKLTDLIGKAGVDEVTDSFTHTMTISVKRHK